MTSTTYPNWFDVTARKNFERHLLPLAGKPGLRFLQLGAFTGDASVWMLENVLIGARSNLIDVDTWQGSNEAMHDEFDWSDVERTYREKTAPYRPRRLAICQATSRAFLESYGEDVFDFIYVDADHTPKGVLEDGVGAYRALKPGGLLAFDDLGWVDPITHVGPAVAIKAIETCYKGRLQLCQLGAQAWFRKVA